LRYAADRGQGGWLRDDVVSRLPALGIKKRILATTYFPEELPPEYLRRWRA
jgi:hypothetical protein